jgi:hypothetical protein
MQPRKLRLRESCSALASGLPYLHQALIVRGHPGGLHVTVLDGEKISATNCVRQPFCKSEIGFTRKAGVYDEQIRWGAGCTWLDYDRDGRLDLFICN